MVGDVVVRAGTALEPKAYVCRRRSRSGDVPSGRNTTWVQVDTYGWSHAEIRRMAAPEQPSEDEDVSTHLHAEIENETAPCQPLAELDKVSFEGHWSSSTAYSMGAMVRHGESLYVRVKPGGRAWNDRPVGSSSWTKVSYVGRAGRSSRSLAVGSLRRSPSSDKFFLRRKSGMLDDVKVKLPEGLSVDDVEQILAGTSSVAPQVAHEEVVHSFEEV